MSETLAAVLALRNTYNTMIEMSKAKLPLSEPGETLYDTAEGEIAALEIIVGFIETSYLATTGAARSVCDKATCYPVLTEDGQLCGQHPDGRFKTAGGQDAD